MSAADGTVRLVRTSERNDFKRCPWMWEQTWVKGLRPRREPTWAWFGTAIHKGLEARYPRGVRRGKPAAVLEAFEEALDGQLRKIYTNPLGTDGPDDLEVVEARELGRAMLLGYIDHFGQDTEWECIHTEQPFQIDVVDDNGVLQAIYAGTWDGLWRNRRTKEFWLVDHKTRKSFPKNWEFYSINDQAGSYLWVAPEVLRHLGIFKKKDKIEGLIFNCLRKAMPDTRPLNAAGQATNKPKKEHYLETLAAHDIHVPKKPTLADLEQIADEMGIKVLGEVSKVQPQELFHREEIHRSYRERVTQAQRVLGEVQEMNRMLSGEAHIWKTPGEDCTRCKLFEFCQLHEENPEEAMELANQLLVVRDPYADHREDFSERGVSV